MGTTQHTAFTTFATSVARFARPLRYLASSLSSTGLDYALLFFLNATIGDLFLPVAIARFASCTMNFLLNRKVFAAEGGMARTAIRYATLATIVMTMSYLSIQALVAAGLSLAVASVTANTALFVVNYLGQKFFVFGSPTAVIASLTSSFSTQVAAITTSFRTTPVAA